MMPLFDHSPVYMLTERACACATLGLFGCPICGILWSFMPSKFNLMRHPPPRHNQGKVQGSHFLIASGTYESKIWIDATNPDRLRVVFMHRQSHRKPYILQDRKIPDVLQERGHRVSEAVGVHTVNTAFLWLGSRASARRKLPGLHGTEGSWLPVFLELTSTAG